jgi:hypothetical protein
MKRAEREMILMEDITKPETPRDRREREALVEDLVSSPLQGRRLRMRLRNFRPAADGYLVALGGPLPYMVRLRTIDELTAEHELRLRDVWRALARSSSGQASFAESWLEAASRWSFDEVNDLIERHNRYYPAESRLPMDPKTRTYALVNGADYRCAELDADWVLTRFPADLERARAALTSLPQPGGDDTRSREA